MLRGRYCVRILRTHIPNWINKVLWVPFSCRETHFPFNFDVILAEIVWFQFEIWIAWIISWTTYYLRDLLNFWKFGDVVSDFPITNFIHLATCVNSAVLGRKRSLSTTCCGVIVGLHLKKKDRDKSLLLRFLPQCSRPDSIYVTHTLCHMETLSFIFHSSIMLWSDTL